MSKRKEREERRRDALRKKQRQERKQSTKSFHEQQEIANITDVIASGAPAPGVNPLSLDQATAGSYAGARAFEELPISRYTKDALKQAGYVTLTAIQRAALPHALAGRDILGAAKTGSGKTLCFLIPVIEKLYRSSWTRLDGLGGLVLTPTRELALQIFEELVKIGRRHDLSAGLLIGGKAVAEEASRVNSMNILVATPGRLLQHMDETPGFEVTGLQILVLDEADRILDMGFAATLDAILDNLPKQGRQTLLFSATQTKSVRDLARLSLDHPEYLAIHSEAATPTPLKLKQAYMVVGLGQKMDVLWGFIKSHLNAKIIVFLSTCKQVRFIYESFRKLRPGMPLRCLHGGMKQGKRMGVFEAFNAKSNSSSSSAGGAGVLFATDIAARGLDFPDVDWVVQADCPEDVAAYIHRVGRTARYTAAGRSLLLLLPSEKDAMLSQLSESKIPLQQLKHNPSKVQAIGPSLSALLSKNPELKAFAQSALVAYLRSVFLQPNKAVFDAAALPVQEYAESLGLLAAPQLKFMKRVGKKVVEEVVLGGEAAAAAAEGQSGRQRQQQQQKGAADVDRQQQEQPLLGKRKRQQQDEQQQQRRGSESDDDLELSPEEDEGPQQQQQQQANISRKQQHIEPHGLSPSAAAADGAADSDDDFLTVKQRDVFDVHPSDDPDQQQQQQEQRPEMALAAAVAAAATAKPKKRKKQRIKFGVVSGQRTVFDDDGQQLDPLELLATQGLGGNTAAAAAAGGDSAADGGGAAGLHVVADAAEQRFELAAQLMVARDRSDKKALAALRKQTRLEKKLRKKALAQGENAPVAVLCGASDDTEQGYSSADDFDNSSDDNKPAAAAAGYSSGDDGPAEPDAAYLGMARKSAAAAADKTQPQQQQQQQQQPVVKQKAAERVVVRKPQQSAGKQALSLAEQEALALQFLSSQPW